MAISGKVLGFMEQASWIRKMFEEGIRLKKEHGEDNVFDLSLGNPVVEPPQKLLEVMQKVAADPMPGQHRYMPNAGYPETRTVVAEGLSKECGLTFGQDDIVMICGAAGGLNITLKTLLDSDDEVIIFAPYFVEYLFYADNHGGKAVVVKTNADFSPDMQALRDAITAKTKAVIISTPNNPTGVVYSRQQIDAMAEVLNEGASRIGHAIYLISDDPYKKIIYDGVETPSIFDSYRNSIYITSHSKDLAVPGERIGYVAVHPQCADAKNLMAGLIFSNRVLGFVNAPALMQRVVREVQDVSVDVEPYRKKRDLLFAEMNRIGYEVVKPQGAFYLFPKSPIEDELKFIDLLAGHKVLAVPGRGFGAPGYFRLAYCVPDRVVAGAIPGLEAAFQEAKLTESGTDA